MFRLLVRPSRVLSRSTPRLVSLRLSTRLALPHRLFATAAPKAAAPAAKKKPASKLATGKTGDEDDDASDDDDAVPDSAREVFGGRKKKDTGAAGGGAAAKPSGPDDAGVKRQSTSTGDDMMHEGQRAKARAARKAALPSHEVRRAGAGALYAGQLQLTKVGNHHVGQYVKLENADAIPEQLRHAIRDELEMTGDYLMLRKDPYLLLSALRVGQLRQHSVLVDGSRGVGKSATLALAAQLTLQRGGLVLATRGEEFLRDRFGQISVSKVRPGVLDQPRLTLRYLRNLRDTQAEALKKIKLQKKYDARLAAAAAPDPVAEKAEEEADDDAADEKAPAAAKPSAAKPAAGEARALETLYDLVLYAGSSRLAAAKHWFDIVEEVQQTKDVQVLIAVDGLNWWDHRAELLDPETASPVRARRLALAAGFLELFEKPPVNGTCLFAMTTVAKDKYVKDYEKVATMTFRLNGYNDAELATVIRHYAVSKMIASTVDQDYFNRVKALSGNVPIDVFDNVMVS